MSSFVLNGNHPQDEEQWCTNVIIVLSVVIRIEINDDNPQDEEQWWTARNSLGQTGSIPVPYVAKVRRQLPLLFDVDIIKAKSRVYLKVLSHSMRVQRHP